MKFPFFRARRLRRTESLRSMVRETSLSTSDFIYPLFVVSGNGTREPISSMPGIERFSVDFLCDECKDIRRLGIPAIILFGIPQAKDSIGTGAWDENGPVPNAIKKIKDAVPELTIIADVCLCEYTSHGHCGPLRAMPGVKDEQEVDNDRTLELLGRAALCYARAGCDIVAPSDMMDGRIGAIRKYLDDEGFDHVSILSYSAKYASAFYGPFRDAADSAPAFGDRRGYQMDPANFREAVREVLLDVGEGADIIMIKPALSYLDVIKVVSEKIDFPIAAYNVSGEYSMVKAASENGWIDGERVYMEILTSIKRAGADLILTYHAKEASRILAGL